ncbi:hypothetical protein [Mesobacillus subterraneus]|uniref:Lipoprotein n=1 Tax=Mesobacillus subterraneus TaxID=285983 RepID=A0A3R9DWM1_9BACI|nr:hypothetical protein [Mesobacillus subterraneus]RSD29054.1 hypothetical protein EJA10_02795 [Mesobacillus subterraneus]
MKRTIGIIGVLLFILTGCSEEERQLKGLVSEKEGEYGLYVVGHEEVDGFKLAEEGIDESKIHIIYHAKSLEVAQENFSTSGIDKEPAYVVLDHDAIVLKTYKYDELVEFLLDKIAQ